MCLPSRALPLGGPGGRIERGAVDRHEGPAVTGAVDVQRTIDDIETSDIVIVPSLVMRGSGWQKGRYPRLVEWLQRMHAGGALLCSACSGIFLLGETGLRIPPETFLDHLAPAIADHAGECVWREIGIDEDAGTITGHALQPHPRFLRMLRRKNS